MVTSLLQDVGCSPNKNAQRTVSVNIIAYGPHIVHCSWFPTKCGDRSCLFHSVLDVRRAFERDCLQEEACRNFEITENCCKDTLGYR
jgi:hypothetical protein